MLSVSIRYNTINDYHFCGLKNDEGVSRSLLRGEIYQEHIWNFIQRYIIQGKSAIDIGANIGHFTVLMGSLINSHASVYSFEPQRIIFQILCTNVILNKLDNVYTYNIALGDGEYDAYLGTFDNKSFDFSDTKSFAAHQIIDKKTSQTTKVVTLDSFNLENIGLIKIDVEDFLGKTLLGCKETISKNQPIILFEDELNRKDKKYKKTCTKKITDFFTNLNYEVGYLKNDDYFAIPKSNNSITL